ncbi:hypothetical protein RAE21_16935 [Rhodoferax sp. TBRC 17198]|uniref:hypothetical protein n=1 Tax=Rhodoferax potami TaxID=3068338 RepID=UPI0028BE4168|nr:hypothetical protein [Rhodoferax sp. TBRC 17198]MDT7524073.1 hypothetical protein [Rhodoferax sp. TBRC 17198]
MKSFKVALGFIISFFIVASIWASSVYWLPKLAIYLQKNTVCTETEKQKLEASISSTDPIACVESLTNLGITGDLFGAVNSLFTGLALFAVAVTLWIDSKARRTSLKPLVIAVADKDFLVIDKPLIKPTASLRFKFEPEISNIVNEPALNVVLKITLRTSRLSQIVSQSALDIPLVSGSNRKIELVSRIDESDLLTDFLSQLTANGQNPSVLIEITYENLESIKWVTKVVYCLQLNFEADGNKLNAFRAKVDGFETIWDNTAAVSIKSSVETGSWRRELAG